MNRSTVITTTTALALAIGAMGLSSPAAASDLKSFSPSVCIPNGAATQDIITYSYQGVFNTSTTNNAVVICPLLKDTNGGTFGTPQNLTAVMRAPGSSSAIVNCTVYVGSLSSGSASSSASTGTVAAGSDGELTVDAAAGSGWVFEPINLVCALSPRARLTRIYMYEDGQTDNTTP